MNLIEKLCPFFKSKKDLDRWLYNCLGYYPHNLSYFKLAFAHTSSHSDKAKLNHVHNNERLEFLGDAVLETTMSHVLYDLFPHQREGFLTEARSVLVRRKTLNKIGAKMHLEEQLHYTENANEKNVLGNCFEALLGAVYLDAGYDQSLKTVRYIYTKYIKIRPFLEHSTNYKSVLLEWVQKVHQTCEFKLVKEDLLPHNIKRFYVECYIDGAVFGLGNGTKKIDAEQHASRKSIELLKRRGLWQ